MKHNLFNITNINLLNKIFLLLLFSFPLIMILRSAVINVTTLITSAIFLFFLIKKIKTNLFKDRILIYLITFLFLIFVNTLFHYQDFALMLKSLGNYRYLILAVSVYFALDSVSEKSKKIFIYFNFYLVILIGLDIVYQYMAQKNIFGFAPGMCDQFGKNCVRFSGVFGDELIAGGYIAQVGLLVFFLLQIIKNQKSYPQKIIEFFYILFLFVIIFITGERNAIIIFSLSILFFYIFQKKYLNLILIFLFFFISIFILSQKINHVHSRFLNPVDNLGNIYHGKKSSLKEKIIDSPWMLHYKAATELFLERPIIGHGTKSFRVLCNGTDIQAKLKNQISRYSACSTHPHNYLLEFLVEHGLIGGMLFIGLMIGIVVKIFKIRNSHTRESVVAIGVGCLLLAIMFPFKPSGSFFSTFNASLLFYIMGFFLYYSRKVK
jgi:O-antigen ligase